MGRGATPALKEEVIARVLRCAHRAVVVVFVVVVVVVVVERGHYGYTQAETVRVFGSKTKKT